MAGFRLGKNKEGVLGPREKTIEDVPIPEGIDFGQLWLEPTDAGSMPMIISAVAAGLSFITMLIVIFKH